MHSNQLEGVQGKCRIQMTVIDHNQNNQPYPLEGNQFNTGYQQQKAVYQQHDINFQSNNYYNNNNVRQPYLDYGQGPIQPQ